MSVSWRSIYLRVCDIMMEPGGLVLGLLTDAQFLKIAGEVLVDFVAKTEAIRGIANLQASYGIQTYAVPDEMLEVQAVAADQQSVEQTSGYYLDNSDLDWQSAIGQPQNYRQDEIPIKQIQLTPAPDYDGNSVSSSNDGYGTISTVTAAEFGISAFSDGYGTISEQVDGNPFIVSTNIGLGVISSIVPSTENISLFGSLLPTNVANIGMSDWVELVPDTFTVYLVYGILSRCFSSDSECKNVGLQKYAQARYSEGINLLGAAMNGIYRD